MKTNSFTKLSSAAALALWLGAFATAKAGPGPQFWNKSSAPAKPAATTSIACAGCKNAPIVAASDRGPAGKGIARLITVGAKHDCTMCDAARAHVTKIAGTTSAPDHATQCGPMACCPAPMK